jgi:hypothetical protein
MNDDAGGGCVVFKYLGKLLLCPSGYVSSSAAPLSSSTIHTIPLTISGTQNNAVAPPNPHRSRIAAPACAIIVVTAFFTLASPPLTLICEPYRDLCVCAPYDFSPRDHHHPPPPFASFVCPTMPASFMMTDRQALVALGKGIDLPPIHWVSLVTSFAALVRFGC